MKNAKNQFDQIAQNQEALVKTLTGNTEKAVAVLSVDEQISAEGKALVQKYMEQQKNLLQESLQASTPEQWMTRLSGLGQKNFEMFSQFTTDYIKFAQTAAGYFTPEQQIKRAETLLNLTKGNVEAITQTAKKNVELSLEYFK